VSRNPTAGPEGRLVAPVRGTCRSSVGDGRRSSACRASAPGRRSPAAAGRLLRRERREPGLRPDRPVALYGEEERGPLSEALAALEEDGTPFDVVVPFRGMADRGLGRPCRAEAVGDFHRRSCVMAGRRVRARAHPPARPEPVCLRRIACAGAGGRASGSTPAWRGTPLRRASAGAGRPSRTPQSGPARRSRSGPPLRRTTGLVAGLPKLALLDRPVPDVSTPCRRRRTPAVKRPCQGSAGPLHLPMDATGIELRGEGGWRGRRHGGDRRRVRRKVPSPSARRPSRSAPPRSAASAMRPCCRPRSVQSQRAARSRRSPRTAPVSPAAAAAPSRAGAPTRTRSSHIGGTPDLGGRTAPGQWVEAKPHKPSSPAAGPCGAAGAATTAGAAPRPG
jgi:hypothetical protein